MTRRQFAALLLPLLIGTAAPAAPEVYEPALAARTFDRAWGVVRDRYWNRDALGPAWDSARDRFRPRAIAAGDRRAFYMVLGEMLASLRDSHVYAIDPLRLEIERAQDAGEAAQGFGFAMLPDDAGDWRVTRVRPASPAARAGVQIGWLVDRVNDAPVDLNYQPRSGETARFVFRDDDDRERRATLTAEEEQPEPLRRTDRLPGGVLLIALGGFDRGDDRWIANEIGAARPAALILDLRGNGGGDADVIARVAGLFFAEDRPLVQRVARRTTVQHAPGAGRDAYLGPLALLVDDGSASGAEALAALVQDSGRGLTVGGRTAGALTGAGYHRLPDGGQLVVAEFDIRTPAGRRLEGVGLSPMIAVTPSLADRRAGRDIVLQRALAALRASPFPPPASSRRSPGSG